MLPKVRGKEKGVAGVVEEVEVTMEVVGVEALEVGGTTMVVEVEGEVALEVEGTMMVVEDVGEVAMEGDTVVETEVEEGVQEEVLEAAFKEGETEEVVVEVMKI